MVEFLEAYGLWIALGGVFVAMHWFGTGCCGGPRRARQEGRDRPLVVADQTDPGRDRGASGSCH